jgi:hypothetical protein
VRARIQADVPEAAPANTATAAPSGGGLLQTSDIRIRTTLVNADCNLITCCTNLIRAKVAALESIVKSCSGPPDRTWSPAAIQRIQRNCIQRFDDLEKNSTSRRVRRLRRPPRRR